MITPQLNSYWHRFFKFDWKFGLFLILLVCIPRFVLVLLANQTGNYASIGTIMFISAAIPFIFLSRISLSSIGICGTRKFKALFIAFVSGIILSLLLYFIGTVLFGNTYQNWYVYIGKSYNIPEVISPEAKMTMFIIMATVGMIFSPIGEELYFRGIVHGSFAQSLGDKKASYVDSAAFAITHIAHFGLVFVNGTWDFYFLPTLLWVAGMFFTSVVFFKMKQLSGSLLGAILCHAGFNLGMIYSIFYLL
ncbi:MAG: CPBP family glutamic-type intramembrane protease [Fulvivirga sp.]|uniref:CPBP family intramembrane glutamic endopeptidase n=2 Tax=Fulvivirga sp. TaxID=1931237 RepID=UPI0032EEC6D8